MKKAISVTKTGLRKSGRVQRAITAASLMALATFSGTLAFMAVISCAPAFAQEPPAGISRQAFQQIQTIKGEKSLRTAVQKKIASALLYAARAANGQPQFPNAPGLALPQLSAGKLVGTDGRVLVDIATTDAAGLSGPIQSLGGSVISSFPAYNTVRASLPITVLESLAALPSVKHIRPADMARTNRIIPPQGSSSESRSGVVREQLGKVLGGNNLGVQANVGTGTTISEAVVAHGANIVQNTGVKGAGVKICVLSDGVDSLASQQSAGELPTVQVLSGQAGSGDEGTAMLELIADMAPGASLGFATGFGSPASMATNITNLRSTLGCNIIVDDVTFAGEAAFQEDVIANAVTTVVNAGAMYFSSAANSGHLSGGESGTWQGDFAPSSAADPPPLAGANLHDFGGSNFNVLTSPGGNISLKWSDPVGAAANDYDLYIMDSTGATILDASTDVQDGNDDPIEFISCTSTNCPTGARILIDQFDGLARALRVDTSRGRLSIGTNGSTFGHNGGVNTISVAAVSNNFLPISGRKFLPSDTITTYSSDGPRKLFINPVPATTPITAGCFLYACGGGTLLPKVDIAAADCDSTAVTGGEGFTTFCGTSAAAPQAAAIAALVKSSNPALTNAQVLARMKTTAIDIMVAGPDVDSGVGIVMADKAVVTTSTGSTAHDFNGDHISDILWRHSNGSVSTWQMAANGAHTAFSFGAVPTAWHIAGTTSLVASTGDVNGGGKSDIFWRHTNGSLSLWEMNGGTSHTPISLGTVITAWQIAGVGDFDGDGHADILWRHTNGSLSIWKMAANGSHTALSFGVVPTAWQVAGIGDVTGEGKADIIWRNTNGSLSIWKMNGGTSHTVLSLGVVATAWQIVGVGDFDHDGHADLFWRHTNGSASIWKMAANGSHTAFSLGTVATAWHIVSIGDYNNDGRADILWRHTNGAASIWKMNANGTHTPLSLGTVATAWTIVE